MVEWPRDEDPELMWEDEGTSFEVLNGFYLSDGEDGGHGVSVFLVKAVDHDTAEFYYSMTTMNGDTRMTTTMPLKAVMDFIELLQGMLPYDNEEEDDDETQRE